jgi:hypothetical protein
MDEMEKPEAGMRILLMGDTHGHWDRINTTVATLRPDVLIQLGDFGYWPNIDRYDPCKHLALGKTQVRFLDGNHENHEELARFRGETPVAREVCPGIFYQERGSFMDLPDGRRILFMGGADSIDKKSRTPGLDWFPGEIITEKDLQRLPAGKVDIVCSHTAPRRFGIKQKFLKRHGGHDHGDDPSEDALDHVFERYRPRWWFFSHWHARMFGESDGCRWFCLDIAGGHRHSYLWLDDPNPFNETTEAERDRLFMQTCSLQSIPESVRAQFIKHMDGKAVVRIDGETRYHDRDVDAFLSGERED